MRTLNKQCLEANDQNSFYGIAKLAVHFVLTLTGFPSFPNYKLGDGSETDRLRFLHPALIGRIDL